MYCRRIVILSGEEGAHGGANGVLQLTSGVDGVSARLALHGLPSVPLAYACVVRVGGQDEKTEFVARDGVEHAWRSGLALTETARIAVIVGVAETAKPLLYGSNFGLPMWESGLPRALAAGCVPASPRKSEEQGVSRSSPLPVPCKKAALQESDAAEEYDDGATAEDNYYPTEFLTYIEGGKRAAGLEAKRVSDWDDYIAVYRPRLAVRHKERQRAEREQPPVARAEESVQTEAAACGGEDHYATVAPTLDKLFAAGEREVELDRALPGTAWTRVAYRNGLYYCVGRIGGTEQRPDYIGYAVPARFSAEPPEPLKGVCRWLPRYAAEPKGKGYWLMFQDAVSGTSIPLRQAQNP